MNSANIKKIWNKINAIRGNRQNSQIKTLSQITTATDSNEIANSFHLFAKNSSFSNYNEEFKTYKLLREASTISETNDSSNSYFNPYLRKGT